MAFIGLRVPQGSAQALSRLARGGKREDPADYHITMVYLGDDLPEAKLAACRQALQRVAGQFTVFDVSAARLTTFPPHPKHGTVPSIVAMEGQELHDLRARVVTALAEEGVEIDMTFPDYKPHVTLSYFPDAAAGAGAPKGQLAPMEYWPVEELYLWGADEGLEDRVSIFPLRTAMGQRLVARSLVAAVDLPRLVNAFTWRAGVFLGGRMSYYEALQAARSGSPTDEQKKLISKCLMDIKYEKVAAIGSVMEAGRPLFLALLTELALPPTLRKQVEKASREWAKTRVRVPGETALALEWYVERSHYVQGSLSLVEEALKQKAHSDGGEAGGGTKLKAGAFTVVNTGGFKPDVMKAMSEIVSKAGTLLQQSGFGEVAYGDVQITNTLSGANVGAFYHSGNDNLYIRGNIKANADLLQIVLHELGHRWQHKKLKGGVVEALYRAVSGEERKKVVKLPAPAVGETVVDKGKTYTVLKVEGQKVTLQRADGGRATTNITDFYLMRGKTEGDILREDAGYKGFVTQYAKKTPAENFAEMFSFYCMGDLPVAQSGLFEDLVFGDGKVASSPTVRKLTTRWLVHGGAEHQAHDIL